MIWNGLLRAERFVGPKVDADGSRMGIYGMISRDCKGCCISLRAAGAAAPFADAGATEGGRLAISRPGTTIIPASRNSSIIP